MQSFNPRSREESDGSVNGTSVYTVEFQSTLPRRERPGVRFLIKDHNKFQSTLPRKERHCGSTVNSGTDVISIHAPAKGATVHRRSAHQHHPYFNPRSREGSDQIPSSALSSALNFNPRSREESDLTVMALPVAAVTFQSTLPRRERRYCQASNRSIRYFNPRSREGSDAQIEKAYTHDSYLFQSTLPRRERQESRQNEEYRQLISIHAPAKGATPISSAFPDFGKLFQSTLPRRERHDIRLVSAGHGTFQSTLPRRERRLVYHTGRYAVHFNPRSREGSDVTRAERKTICRLFQSTLPRRERPFAGLQFPTFRRYFNPRSREGSDPRTGNPRNYHSDFNPRSREGSDSNMRLTVAIA